MAGEPSRCLLSIRQAAETIAAFQTAQRRHVARHPTRPIAHSRRGAASLPGMRAAILRRWYELQLAHAEEIAQIMTAEQGKPLVELRGEIAYGAAFVEFFAEEAKRIYGETIPTPWPSARIVIIASRLGRGGHHPGNFLNRDDHPQGCPGVCGRLHVRPEAGPRDAAVRAGCGGTCPSGRFSRRRSQHRHRLREGHRHRIHSNSAACGRHLHGLDRIGKLLMHSAPTVKKVWLELGGNAPFIVFDDADLDVAVSGAMASSFRNQDRLVFARTASWCRTALMMASPGKLADRVSKMKVGPGAGRRRGARAADQSSRAGQG